MLWRRDAFIATVSAIPSVAMRIARAIDGPRAQRAEGFRFINHQAPFAVAHQANSSRCAALEIACTSGFRMRRSTEMA